MCSETRANHIGAPSLCFMHCTFLFFLIFVMSQPLSSFLSSPSLKFFTSSGLVHSLLSDQLSLSLSALLEKLLPDHVVILLLFLSIASGGLRPATVQTCCVWHLAFLQEGSVRLQQSWNRLTTPTAVSTRAPSLLYVHAHVHSLRMAKGWLGRRKQKAKVQALVPLVVPRIHLETTDHQQIPSSRPAPCYYSNQKNSNEWI